MVCSGHEDIIFLEINDVYKSMIDFYIKNSPKVSREHILAVAEDDLAYQDFSPHFMFAICPFHSKPILFAQIFK